MQLAERVHIEARLEEDPSNRIQLSMGALETTSVAQLDTTKRRLA